MNARERASAALYTAELLGFAVRLAEWPWRNEHELNGKARSRTCGSVVALSLAVADNRVSELGLKVSACAIGQAAAAIFAGTAVGRSEADIRQTRDELGKWLSGSGAVPRWPDLVALEPALPHQGRHGAILLPWDAALDALSNSASPA